MKRPHVLVPGTARILVGVFVAILAMGSPVPAQDAGADADRDWRFIEKLEEDGMADLAVRQLEEFAGDHPDDPRASFALLRAAEGRRELGQTVAANELFERLLREYPSSEAAPSAALQRADLLTAAQRFDEAAEAYRSLLSAYPAADEVEAARLGLAEALMATGDDAEARRLLGRLIGGRAADDVGSRALFDLALLDQRAGADSLAIERFDAIHERYPGRPIAAFGLLRAAGLLEEREADSAARTRYERLLDGFGEPVVRARAHLGLAALVEDDDPTRAMQHYRAVAEEGGGAADVQTALLGLARSALAAGEPETVREATTAFVEKYPDAPGADRARLLRLRSDRAEGREGAVDALLALGREARGEVAVDALALAADLLEERGDVEGALQAWRQAEIVAPDPATRSRALLARARLSVARGRPSLAADLALAAHATAEQSDTRAEALLRAVEARMAADRDQEAIDLAHQLVTEHPITPWASRARVHLRVLVRRVQADPTGAALELVDLASTVPEDPVDRAIDIATVLRDRLDRSDVAVTTLEAALDDARTPRQRARLEIQIAAAHRQRALELGVDGRGDEARRALDAARAALTEAAARTAAEEQARRARLQLVALDLASGARPDAPWLFDPDSMPLLGAVGEAERVDLGSADFDPARRRLTAALEGAQGADRAWIAWRLAELSTDPVADRVARLREELDGQVPQGLEPALRAALGYLLLEAGETTAAAREFSRVIDRAPNGALAMSVRYGLAEAQRAEKRYAQAGELYAEFATAHPRTQKGQRALLLAGDCALYAGRSDEAVARYRHLLERYPGSVYEDDALYRLGTALQRAGRTEAAREPLLTLVESDTGYRGRALARLGALERDRGDLDAAAEAYVRLVESDPERAAGEGAWRALASVELERGNPDEALRRLDEAADRLEPDAVSLTLRVEAAAAAGRLEAAASALQSLSRGFPDAADAIAAARMDLADARVEAGDPESALEDYRLAATETDDSVLRARAEYGVALVHARAQRWADAREAFASTVDIAPRSDWAAEALFKLGQFHARTDDPKASQEAFATMFERFPDHRSAAEALRGEARAWRQMNRFDEALERYHRILEEFPDIEDGADVLSNIAYCHHELGRYEVAIAAYQRVMPLLDEEGQAYAQFWVADSLARMGRHEEAATEFLRIPYLYPSQGQLPVTAQLKAGEAYEMVPDPEAARRLYERVLARYGPNSQWGGEAQRRLDRLAEGDRGSR
ncbi:MAG TPA: tetratricopeptide repeat protein [Candidatus Krumholzibacteria bacterium]|nr:tetratricopeptide repeat protein [Candidatus Krumholzibacteria bacterium]